MTTWAFLYGHPGTDPHTDRTVIESDGLRTILVPVPDESQAPAIAVELIESDAIALLELCGGFGAVDAALANFYASGVLALGRKTGPFLWQLPATYGFDAARLEAFLRRLPRSSLEAAELARRHDGRLKRGALVEAPVGVPYRHALEPRHPSWFQPACYALLRAHGCALVVADAAGLFPTADVALAPFAYYRLHGAEELYASRYDDDALQRIVDYLAERQPAHIPDDATGYQTPGRVQDEASTGDGDAGGTEEPSEEPEPTDEGTEV